MTYRVLSLLVLALAACRGATRTTAAAPPPAAEFILSAGDSAYWIRTDTSGVHMRGAPIELARLGGRFVEVYVVDDDHSFPNADLVGQSVFRRDLRTGDSTRVFTDSLVPAIAREYALEHPRERHLAPDEEGDADPELRATATLEFSGTHGEFVSFTLHTDVERAGKPFWHTSRHGVLDLRTGKLASLSDVVGAEAPAIAHRRDEMWRTLLDSVRVRAAELLPRYRLDPSSFTITTVNGAPAIAYAIPTIGSGETDQTLPLPPVTFHEPSWWRDVASSLPETSPDGAQDRWRHAGYSVLARYDSLGDGRLSLRDSTSHEWLIGTISAPASIIYWLDKPSFDPETRHALTRAFNEAARYGTESHVALHTPRSPVHFTSYKR